MKNPFESGRPPAERSLEWKERVSVGSFTIAKERKDRPRNEDTLLVLPDQGVFGVFDGVGGHVGGDQASQTAARIFQEQAKSISRDEDPIDGVTWMREAFEKAGAAILKEARGDRRGATGAVVRLCRGKKGVEAVVGHVGDSRIYRARDLESLDPLTIDDSSASPEQQRALARAAARSDIAFDPALLHFFAVRSVITRWIGDGNAEAQISRLPLKPEERLLLLSDGVSDNLTENEMLSVLDALENDASAAKRLCDLAHRRSLSKHFRAKPDDISAILLRLKK